ncbi:uncharacterized protein EV154DRAFT_231653 [Mucor mucedo]|uniref:uncharacterized protein n=1 Tax=Mucor mucedo TaxID=29922 RepID=UPI0022203EC6|nr:uncharacterized protein EV154DRAFT_231653 [Mucor mucedo]KAI7891073.1 hypothetical protein EV154DRAFT_231653 [Mucor mucedo]
MLKDMKRISLLITVLCQDSVTTRIKAWLSRELITLNGAMTGPLSMVFATLYLYLNKRVNSECHTYCLVAPSRFCKLESGFEKGFDFCTAKNYNFFYNKKLRFF